MLYVKKYFFCSHILRIDDIVIKETFKKLVAEFTQTELWEDLQMSFEVDGTVEWWSHHPCLEPHPENATDEELGIMCQALKA